MSAQILAAALWYAANGYHVFPCRPGGKEPITARGFHDATTDRETVKSWWAANPIANIGIATEASCLVVVDVDTKNNGDQTYEELREELGAEAFDTVTALTPSGGQHFVYATDGALVSSGAHVLGQGIDIRAAGGYIVAAPSIVNGKIYAWETGYSPRDRKPAVWPDALAAKINKRSLAATLPTEGKIPDGERNATLTSIAGSLRRRGLDKDEILGALHVVNAKRCSPMLSNYDLEKIAESISRYEPSEVIGTVPEVLDSPTAEPIAHVFGRIHNRMDDNGGAIPFGIRELDEKLGGMYPGRTTVWAARTGVGKSAGAEHIVERAALSSRVLYCAIELGSVDTVERIAARHQQTPVRLYREAGRPMHDTGWLQSLNLYILGSEKRMSVGATAHEVDKLRPGLVVIDHARRLKGWFPEDGKMRADLAPARIMMELNELAKIYKTHVLLLQQCPRSADGTRPSLAELRDSGAIEESADNVIFIHRPFQFGDPDYGIGDNVAEFCVWKSREAGVFIAHTEFKGEYMQFIAATQTLLAIPWT